MSYQTSYKRSRPFWLLIGARKRFCFSAQSERSRPWSHFVCSYTQSTWTWAVRHVYLSCSWRLILKRSRWKQNARENVRNICDYLTGKYAGPFVGIITVAYSIKFAKNSDSLMYNFWMQGDISLSLAKLKFLQLNQSGLSFCTCSGRSFCSWLIYWILDHVLVVTETLAIFLSHGPGTTCSWCDRQPDTYLHDFLSVKSKNSDVWYTDIILPFSCKIKLSIYW